MNFRSKVKFYIGIIRALGIKEPLALRKVDKVTVLILCNIRLFKPRKIQKLFMIMTRDPAGFVKWKRIEHNGSAILMQQPILNNFKL